jgi:hypothetical protein
MLTPWKNPRSENLWFRRRVPPKLVAFMGRTEVKFSFIVCQSASSIRTIACAIDTAPQYKLCSPERDRLLIGRRRFAGVDHWGRCS